MRVRKKGIRMQAKLKQVRARSKLPESKKKVAHGTEMATLEPQLRGRGMTADEAKDIADRVRTRSRSRGRVEKRRGEDRDGGDGGMDIEGVEGLNDVEVDGEGRPLKKRKAGESAPGSWVGARRLIAPSLLTPHRAPHGFGSTHDPSADYYAAPQTAARAEPAARAGARLAARARSRSRAAVASRPSPERASRTWRTRCGLSRSPTALCTSATRARARARPIVTCRTSSRSTCTRASALASELQTTVKAPVRSYLSICKFFEKKNFFVCYYGHASPAADVARTQLLHQVEPAAQSQLSHRAQTDLPFPFAAVPDIIAIAASTPTLLACARLRQSCVVDVAPIGRTTCSCAAAGCPVEAEAATA